MVFVSDLDNVLIHSYKTAQPGDICIEEKDGVRLSFMAPDAHALLKAVASRCLVVPATARSKDQYLRIDFGVQFKHAIVANGALLLDGGEIDEQWAAETRQMCGAPLPDIKPNEFLSDIRVVDGFFIFAKSNAPAKAASYLRSAVDAARFEVRSVKNKVYVLPVGVNKGSAVRRLAKRLKIGRIICAGDSVLDIPMLELADVAIVPEALGFDRGRPHVVSSAAFASEALNIVKRYVA